MTESVQVTANAAQVETKENSIAQVVDQQRLIDMPLNGRNPADLLRLTGFSTSDMQLNGGDLTGSKNIQGSNGSGAVFCGRRRGQRRQLPAGWRRQ